jgi:hypothetical protein
MNRDKPTQYHPITNKWDVLNWAVLAITLQIVVQLVNFGFVKV